MASAGGDAGSGRPPAPTSDRPKPDRRAEALRANLKRRKAQTRARDQARHDDPEVSSEADVPSRDS